MSKMGLEITMTYLNSSEVIKANKHQMLWLLMLIGSFAYDIPIFELTPFERVNPRFVDILTILGVFFILPKLKHQKLPQFFHVWKYTVSWFLICSLIWSAFWLPWKGVGMFSIFYAFRYIQGLLLLYIVLSIPLTSNQKKSIMYMVVLGGLFVALYAIPEYFRKDTVRYIAGGKAVYRAPGTLLSSLGTSYHHLAGFSSLSFAVALGCVSLVKSKYKILMFIIALIVAWPAIFSGARSGILAIFIIFLLSVVYLRAIRNYILIALLLFIPIAIVGGGSSVDFENLSSNSSSINRLMNMEDVNKSNDITARLGVGNYSLSLYEWQGARLPLFGGGFYVTPHTIDGGLHYRIGFGIHNSYLFPFEQAGFIGGGLSLFLLYVIYKSLSRMRRSFVKEDSIFATVVFMFFVTQIISGFFGGNALWQSVGIENLSNYVLIIYGLAINESNSEPAL
jgi:hypothetical protein